MQGFLRLLQVHLRARYPLLYLITYEEQRVWRVLQHLATEEDREIWRWRHTVGLEGPQGVVPNSQDPAEALRLFDEHSRPALCVLWDMHPYMNDPLVIRRLRDLCISVGGKNQNLIIMGPRLAYPEELEKSISIIDVPLPSREEGERLLRVLCERQKIALEPERFERFIQGSMGLTEEEIKRLYSRILLGGNAFSEADINLQIEEKKKAIRRSRFLEFWDTSQLGLRVGGLDNLKAWLQQRKQSFSPQATAYGLPQPKGLFLLGVQGCGKSLMAKAVAQMWQLPLLRLDVAAVFQRTSTSQEGLRETIRIAENLAPSVLWIDELEKGFASADSVSGGEGLGYFLTWMQEKQKPVFVVATANEVRALPPELLRKGRFDEIFFVDLPDIHERLEILDIHLRMRNRDPEDFDLTFVVEESERFSGAELEQVVISALFHAFSENREITTFDLLEATREIVPLAVTMDDRLKDLRDWARPRARRATADRRRVDFFHSWEERNVST